MRRVALALALVLAVAWPAGARGERLAIGLMTYQPVARLVVSSPGRFAIAGSRWRGGEVALEAVGARVRASRGGKTVALAHELRLLGDAPWTLAAGSRRVRYEGELAVHSESGRLVPVLTVPLEAYVEAATGAEMRPDWPSAAIEAQAIAVRSYALAMKGRHRSQGYDLCDSTHCQSFRGLAGADARVRAAVGRTSGRYLSYRGRPATALWHSTCGGERAANESVFGGTALPYLRAGGDQGPGGAWCRESPHFKPWRAHLGAEELAVALRRSGVLAPGEGLEEVAVVDRLADGTAMTVRLTGARSRTLTGYAFWMALGPSFGWGEIKSPAFEVESARGGFVIRGTGLGHRVGMCQWGARGRALAGQSAEQILRAYYPGTALRRL